MARLEMLAENNLIQAAVQSENIIHNLNNVGNFNSTALKHILQSEINAGGRVVGFHYEGMPYSGGKVTPGTAEAPNSYGVYRAKVEVDGVAKTSNDGYSTFFPKNMSPQEVVDSINEAYSNRILVQNTHNKYNGTSTRGFTIDMYIDKSGNITSAFPEM